MAQRTFSRSRQVEFDDDDDDDRTDPGVRGARARPGGSDVTQSADDESSGFGGTRRFGSADKRVTRSYGGGGEAYDDDFEDDDAPKPRKGGFGGLREELDGGGPGSRDYSAGDEDDVPMRGSTASGAGLGRQRSFSTKQRQEVDSPQASTSPKFGDRGGSRGRDESPSSRSRTFSRSSQEEVSGGIRGKGPLRGELDGGGGDQARSRTFSRSSKEETTPGKGGSERRGFGLAADLPHERGPSEKPRAFGLAADLGEEGAREGKVSLAALDVGDSSPRRFGEQPGGFGVKADLGAGEVERRAFGGEKFGVGADLSKEREYGVSADLGRGDGSASFGKERVYGGGGKEKDPALSKEMKRLTAEMSNLTRMMETAARPAGRPAVALQRQIDMLNGPQREQVLNHLALLDMLANRPFDFNQNHIWAPTGVASHPVPTKAVKPAAAPQQQHRPVSPAPPQRSFPFCCFMRPTARKPAVPAQAQSAWQPHSQQYAGGVQTRPAAGLAAQPDWKAPAAPRVAGEDLPPVRPGGRRFEREAPEARSEYDGDDTPRGGGAGPRIERSFSRSGRKEPRGEREARGGGGYDEYDEYDDYDRSPAESPPETPTGDGAKAPPKRVRSVRVPNNTYKK